eukprot:5785690-Pleurochrysis_carterae.AAC.1
MREKDGDGASGHGVVFDHSGRGEEVQRSVTVVAEKREDLTSFRDIHVKHLVLATSFRPNVGLMLSPFRIVGCAWPARSGNEGASLCARLLARLFVRARARRLHTPSEAAVSPRRRCVSPLSLLQKRTHARRLAGASTRLGAAAAAWSTIYEGKKVDYATWLLDQVAHTRTRKGVTLPSAVVLAFTGVLHYTRPRFLHPDSPRFFKLSSVRNSRSGPFFVCQVSKVTVSDVLHSLKKYIVPLFDPSANLAATCPTNKVELAKQGFEEMLGIEVRVMTEEQICCHPEQLAKDGH